MNKQFEKTVFIVDDDPKVRDALQWLFESVDLAVETFENAKHFIDNYNVNKTGCLIVDVRMPGMSGLELLEHLKLTKCHLPIIVTTGHGDVPMAVRAMKVGAIDFISKPFNDQYLIDKIQKIFSRIEVSIADLDNNIDVIDL
jgi:two-component system, LuxR family, response regulator FixJ